MEKKTVDHVYIFPDVMFREGKLKLNMDDNWGFELLYNDSVLKVSGELIRPFCSYMVIFDSQTRELFMVSKWDKVMHHFGHSGNGLLTMLKMSSFMQIEYFGRQPFIKVFLPKNQFTLESDTHDFSLCAHMPLSAVHPVDWVYQPSAILREIKKENDVIIMELETIPSVLSDKVWWRYGKQSGELDRGRVSLIVQHEPGERLRIEQGPYNDECWCSINIEERM